MRRSAVVLGGAAAVGIAAAVWASVSSTTYLTMCPACARLRATWQLEAPGTHAVLLRRHRERHTPLSRLLAERGVVGEHAHEWLLARGVGELGVGAGGGLTAQERAARVVAFTRNLTDYGEPAALAAWLERAARPQTVRDAVDGLVASGFPRDGFTSGAAFAAWWRDHAAAFGAGPR